MSIVQFVPKRGIEPIFAVKLSPSLCKIIDALDRKEADKILKSALNIKENRLIDLKEVEDATGNSAYILIVYDYIYVKERPKVVIPQTDDGYFDFRIYQLDFNSVINIENIIADQKILMSR